MAIYSLNEWAYDNLEGAADDVLAGRSPTFGPPWLNGHNNALNLDGTGGVYTPGAVVTWLLAAYLTGDLPAADQFAQCQVSRLTDLGFPEKAGVALRASATGSPLFFQAGYVLYYDTAAAGWKLSKIAANVETVLATYDAAGQSIGVGESGSGILTVTGDQLVAITNGVEHAPVTNADIAGPGAAALLVQAGDTQTATTGMHLRAPLFASRP